MSEEYNKEQIEEFADGMLNKHKSEMADGKPFAFHVAIGEKSYNVRYAKDSDGSWKFQDYNEL